MSLAKTGSLLVLVSSVITFVVSLIPLVFLFTFSYVDNSSINFETAKIVKLTLTGIFAFVLISAFAKLYSSKLIKVAKLRVRGSIIAIIFGVLTIDIVCLIGGIFGLND